MSQNHRRVSSVGKRTNSCSYRKLTKTELVGILFRQHKREMIRRGIIQDPADRPPRYRFDWAYGDITGEVYADDRSDARGMIKRELGIRKKKRLPIEVEIIRTINPLPEDDKLITLENIEQSQEYKT